MDWGIGMTVEEPRGRQGREGVRPRGSSGLGGSQAGSPGGGSRIGMGGCGNRCKAPPGHGRMTAG